MKKFLKYPLLFFLLYLIYLNVALHYQADFKTENSSTYNADVYNQLQFLERKIDEGAAEKMQKFYPEGYLS